MATTRLERLIEGLTYVMKNVPTDWLAGEVIRTDQNYILSELKALQADLDLHHRPQEETLAKLANEVEQITEGLHKSPDSNVWRVRLVDVAHKLQTLAMHGAGAATKAEWLGIAFDLAQDTGEVPPSLARGVARLLPEILLTQDPELSKALARVDPATFWVAVPRGYPRGPYAFVGDFEWCRYSISHTRIASIALLGEREDKTLWTTGFPGIEPLEEDSEISARGFDPFSLRDAMASVDSHLRTKGRILLGDAPEDIVLLMDFVRGVSLDVHIERFAFRDIYRALTSLTPGASPVDNRPTLCGLVRAGLNRSVLWTPGTFGGQPIDRVPRGPELGRFLDFLSAIRPKIFEALSRTRLYRLNLWPSDVSGAPGYQGHFRNWVDSNRQP